MAALFAVGLALWVLAMALNAGNNRGIHILILALGVLKTAALLAEAAMYTHRSPLDPQGGKHAADVAYYALTFLRSSCLYLVLFHVGSGWSHMNPLLGSAQQKALMLFLPLQVLL